MNGKGRVFVAGSKGKCLFSHPLDSRNMPFETLEIRPI